jgi:hypothetical protein
MRIYRPYPTNLYPALQSKSCSLGSLFVATSELVNGLGSLDGRGWNKIEGGSVLELAGDVVHREQLVVCGIAEGEEGWGFVHGELGCSTELLDDFGDGHASVNPAPDHLAVVVDDGGGGQRGGHRMLLLVQFWTTSCRGCRGA